MSEAHVLESCRQLTLRAKRIYGNHYLIDEIISSGILKGIEHWNKKFNFGLFGSTAVFGEFTYILTSEQNKLVNWIDRDTTDIYHVPKYFKNPNKKFKLEILPTGKYLRMSDDELSEALGVTKSSVINNRYRNQGYNIFVVKDCHKRFFMSINSIHKELGIPYREAKKRAIKFHMRWEKEK